MGRWGGKRIGYRVVAESSGPGVSWTRVRTWLCHCQLCDLGPQFPNLLNGQNNRTYFPGYRQEWKWVSEGTGERGRDLDLGERAAPSAPQCGVSPDSEGTPTLSLFPSPSQKTPYLTDSATPSRTEKVPEEDQAATVTTVTHSPGVRAALSCPRNRGSTGCSQWKLRLRWLVSRPH